MGVQDGGRADAVPQRQLHLVPELGVILERDEALDRAAAEQLRFVAVRARTDDRRARRDGDRSGLQGVIEMAVPDDDVLGVEVDEVLRHGGHVVGLVLLLVDVGVEQHDVAVNCGRERRDGHPGKMQLPTRQLACHRIDVLGSEETLSRRDGSPQKRPRPRQRGSSGTPSSERGPTRRPTRAPSSPTVARSPPAPHPAPVRIPGTLDGISRGREPRRRVDHLP